MPNRIGFEAKLYYMVGGQASGGAWVEATEVLDLDPGFEADAVEAAPRGSGDWKAYLYGRKDASIGFDLLYDRADAFYVALKSAWFTRAVLGIKILDAASGEGFQLDVIVAKLSRSEPVGDALKTAVELKPAKTATAPSAITAS